MKIRRQSQTYFINVMGLGYNIGCVKAKRIRKRIDEAERVRVSVTNKFQLEQVSRKVIATGYRRRTSHTNSAPAALPRILTRGTPAALAARPATHN